jgi:transposase InsO family protein
MAEPARIQIAALAEHNYPSWALDMRAILMVQSIWTIVDGSEAEPSDNLEKADWRARRTRAAGLIYLNCTPSQKAHIIQHIGDPVAMWATLYAAHNVKKPGARFNLYRELFGAQMLPEESPMTLGSRIAGIMQRIKDLQPATYTITDLYNELQAMALISSLPAGKFDTVVTKLVLEDTLTPAIVVDQLTAFRLTDTTGSSSNTAPAVALAVQAKPALSSNFLRCDFCDGGGHDKSTCNRLATAQAQAKKEVLEYRAQRAAGKKKKQRANEATQDAAASTAPSPASEFAGNASALSLSDSTTPLISDAGADWIPDTGATSHMSPHRHWFHSYTPSKIAIRLADNKVIHSAGVGSVRFASCIDGKRSKVIEFDRVLHVPALRSNLLSVLYLTQHKHWAVTIMDSRIFFRHNGVLELTATVDSNNRASLDGVAVPVPHAAMPASTVPLDISLWHRRLGHLNVDAVRRMAKQGLVTGMHLDSTTAPDPICEPCLAGKQHRPNVPKSASRAKQPLDRIYTDLRGPFPVQSPEGYRYWAIFVDDCTRHYVIAFLRHKSEAFAALKAYKQWAEVQTGCKVKVFHFDKGGEWMSLEMKSWLRLEGIDRELTITGEAHQNGVAERPNRVVGEAVIAMMQEANLPPSWWARAASAFVYTRNRSFTSALDGKTPHEALLGKKPDLSLVRVFGCTSYVHVPQNQRNKLQSHTLKCIFAGYAPEHKGYLFFHPETRQTITSNAAVFDERYFPGLKTGTPFNTDFDWSSFLPDEDASDQVGDVPGLAPDDPRPATVLLDVPAVPARRPAPQAPPAVENAPAPAPVDPDSDGEESDDPLLLKTPPPAPRARRRIDYGPPSRFSGRIAGRPPSPVLSVPVSLPGLPPTPVAHEDESEDELLLRDAVDEAFSAMTGDCELLDLRSAFERAFAAVGRTQADPQTLKEALSRPDAEEWIAACEKEMDSLLENGTWELVRLPPGKKAVASKWVFRVKHKPDGSVERHKARLVAKGFSQIPGIDFFETFASTTKWAALRAVLALAALEDLEMESVDISSAFLNGDMDAEVYMQQPEGFVQKGREWVCRLLKSLYGLKQASRLWQQKLDEVLSELGFSRIQSDASIWVWSNGTCRVIIPVYVDDMTIVSKDKSQVARVKVHLQKHFKLRDLGPTTWLLGVEIARDRSQRKLTMSQRQYIVDMLERHQMSDCHPVRTPMNPGCKLSKDDSPLSKQEAEYVAKFNYPAAVGELLYLAGATRPDIARTVSYLCRFNSCPRKEHCDAVKHLWRYLQGTKDLKLTYAPSASPDLFVTYTDADHGGCADSGKSTSAYVVLMGTGAISWMSKLQPIVALSTTEAEYVAATSAGQEIIWLRNLLLELGFPCSAASPLLVDNQSAISVAKNPEHHGRMKHLDLRFFWLRGAVQRKQISVSYVPTADQVADLLTKALTPELTLRHRSAMGLA